MVLSLLLTKRCWHTALPADGSGCVCGHRAEGTGLGEPWRKARRGRARPPALWLEGAGRPQHPRRPTEWAVTGLPPTHGPPPASRGRGRRAAAAQGRPVPPCSGWWGTGPTETNGAQAPGMSGGAPLWRHRWGVPDTWAVGGQPAQRSDEWGIEKPRRCEGTHRPRGGWGTGVQTAGPRPPAGPGTQAERDASGHSGPRGPARGPRLSRHRGDRSAESPCPDPGSDGRPRGAQGVRLSPGVCRSGEQALGGSPRPLETQGRQGASGPRRGLVLCCGVRCAVTHCTYSQTVGSVPSISG